MHQDPELNALEECFDLLDALNPQARERVLSWLNNRFATQQVIETPTNGVEVHSELESTLTNEETSSFENRINGMYNNQNGSHSGNKVEIKIKTLEELAKHISGVTESEKALLMAAYLQTVQNQHEMSGRVINDYLKKFDEGVKNITSALRVLIQKNPALIRQTFKSGNLAQSQKKYQVTEAGFEYANSLLHVHKS